MKPLINLKAFLAVLLILIVPAALLVAYFRNYSSEAGGHEHSEMAKGGGAAMGKDGDMSAMKPGGEGHAAMEHGGMAKGGDEDSMKPGGDSNAATGHGDMAMPQGGQMQPQQQGKMPQPPEAQPQKEGGHAAMGHAIIAQPAAAQAQAQQAQAPSRPGAVVPARATKVAEPMQEGINEMGRVQGLKGSAKDTAGVFHSFHTGAKDFFLDHTQHLTLSAEQQKRLHQIKEQALLDKSSADRKIHEAEQQLWKTTSAEHPDAAEIETKVRQVEKLRADQRLAFIRSVSEAAMIITEEQMKSLLGTEAADMPDLPATNTAPRHKP